MSEYCPECGSTLEAGSRFCSNCGADVDIGAGTHASASLDHQLQQEGSFEDELAQARANQGNTTFAAITHILGLLTWVIGPLIVLVAADDEFTKQNARNALNWQIMFTIYMILSLILVFVLVGFFLLLLIPLLDLVFCVLAAVKASEGEAWRYPATPDIV